MAAISGASNIDLLPLQPPPGIVPNFVNPPDRTFQLYVVAGVCLPLILLFASLRLYAKLWLIQSRTKDDCKKLYAGCGTLGADRCPRRVCLELGRF